MDHAANALQTEQSDETVETGLSGPVSHDVEPKANVCVFQMIQR